MDDAPLVSLDVEVASVVDVLVDVDMLVAVVSEVEPLEPELPLLGPVPASPSSPHAAIITTQNSTALEKPMRTG